jgi:FlaG/FlaF family flagellin (archaellin)
MVAITVILAAVIGTFVLGLGDQVQQTSPTAQFGFDYTEGEQLEISHEGGDGISSSQLSIINAGNTYTETSSDDAEVDGASTASEWFIDTTSDDTVTAGDTAVIDDSNDLDADQDVRVAWTADEGDRSSTLATWES